MRQRPPRSPFDFVAHGFQRSLNGAVAIACLTITSCGPGGSSDALGDANPGLQDIGAGGNDGPTKGLPPGASAEVAEFRASVDEWLASSPEECRPGLLAVGQQGCEATCVAHAEASCESESIAECAVELALGCTAEATATCAVEARATCKAEAKEVATAKCKLELSAAPTPKPSVPPPSDESDEGDEGDEGGAGGAAGAGGAGGAGGAASSSSAAEASSAASSSTAASTSATSPSSGGDTVEVNLAEIEGKYQTCVAEAVAEAYATCTAEVQASCTATETSVCKTSGQADCTAAAQASCSANSSDTCTATCTIGVSEEREAPQGEEPPATPR